MRAQTTMPPYKTAEQIKKEKHELYLLLMDWLLTFGGAPTTAQDMEENGWWSRSTIRKNKFNTMNSLHTGLVTWEIRGYVLTRYATSFIENYKGEQNDQET